MTKTNKNKVDGMKKKPQMSYPQSCQLRAIHQIGGWKLGFINLATGYQVCATCRSVWYWSLAEIIRNKRRYPGFQVFSTATIYRHAKYPLDGTDVFDKRVLNKGRPSKLSEYDRRSIGRQVLKLCEQEGSFSSRRIQAFTVGNSVSNSTVRRALNTFGYGYHRTRKKGLLTHKDLKLRLKFARKLKKLNLGHRFWTTGISFYLDAAGFVYKRNPMDQVRTPKAREWRKKNEGLSFRCTTKGSKEGTNQAKFVVAISYKFGVVLCSQYDSRLNGAKFAKLIREQFPVAFVLSVNPKGKRILQDGCPVQNSQKQSGQWIASKHTCFVFRI